MNERMKDWFGFGRRTGESGQKISLEVLTALFSILCIKPSEISCPIFVFLEEIQSKKAGNEMMRKSCDPKDSRLDNLLVAETEKTVCQELPERVCQVPWFLIVFLSV